MSQSLISPSSPDTPCGKLRQDLPDTTLKPALDFTPAKELDAPAHKMLMMQPSVALAALRLDLTSALAHYPTLEHIMEYVEMPSGSHLTQTVLYADLSSPFMWLFELAPK